jgi:hypothetical protein
MTEEWQCLHALDDLGYSVVAEPIVESVSQFFRSVFAIAAESAGATKEVDIRRPGASIG